MKKLLFRRMMERLKSIQFLKKLKAKVFSINPLSTDESSLTDTNSKKASGNEHSVLSGIASSSKLTAQMALVRTQDYVNKSVRQQLGQLIPEGGTIVDSKFIAHIHAAVSTQLDRFVADNVLADHNDVVVSTDGDDIINIDYTFKPTFPMSSVTASVKMTQNEDGSLTTEEALVQYLENKPW